MTLLLWMTSSQGIKAQHSPSTKVAPDFQTDSAALERPRDTVTTYDWDRFLGKDKITAESTSLFGIFAPFWTNNYELTMWRALLYHMPLLHLDLNHPIVNGKQHYVEVRWMVHTSDRVIGNKNATKDRHDFIARVLSSRCHVVALYNQSLEIVFSYANLPASWCYSKKYSDWQTKSQINLMSAWWGRWLLWTTRQDL